MLDGKLQGEISLGEARALAARIGVPVPPISDALYKGERNAAGEPKQGAEALRRALGGRP
jgi:hypothetical protein